MKLYTEEEIKNQLNPDLFNLIEPKLTPIELPSDKKIDAVAEKTLGVSMNGFRLGAKWLKEQILKQTK
jgi:hypothetical protein